jgi:hypothetical protein
MYTIEQEVANSIAKTVPMIYPQMKALFSMTEEEADKWELELTDEITKMADDDVARAVVALLPLYLGNWALTIFIRKTKNQSLRNIMPEIL